jgi:hypothetical protein
MQAAYDLEMAEEANAEALAAIEPLRADAA